MAIEERELGALVLNEQNPRDHTLEQIELISSSMEEFGWTIPILVDEQNVILAGHGRVRAARLKGWKVAPVVVARGWTEEQKRAYLITDNRLAERSDWNRKTLQTQLRALQAADFDMDLVGFSDEELQKLTIDTPQPVAGEPKEVVMKQCPTCGRMSRKVGNETP